MIVPQRNPDELSGAPALATLAALSASIDAFVTVLDLTHPRLRAMRPPVTECEQAAMLLYMHLEACQGLLITYDALTFDGFETTWKRMGRRQSLTTTSPSDLPGSRRPGAASFGAQGFEVHPAITAGERA